MKSLSFVMALFLLVSCGGEKKKTPGSTDVCESGVTQNGTTVCGLNNEGVFVQNCIDGAWVESTICTGTDVCENDAMQNGTTVCGLNNEGVFAQNCIDGAWVDSTTCTGSDGCKNGTSQNGTTVCGDNNEGVFIQNCTDGVWVDSLFCATQSPTISISDVTTTNESATDATISVTLSGTSTYVVTVDYATADGTAVHGLSGAGGAAGADYAETTGTLSFPAGETAATFAVPVLDDTRDEADETVTITLSNPNYATIGDAIGTLTITDDDAEPSLSLADITTDDESAGEATCTVTLSEVSGQTITVDYETSNGTALAGTDYTAASGTLTFAPGEAAKTFGVAILSDNDEENNETVTLTISNPDNATINDATGTLTISDDDDAPGISIEDTSTANESPANITLTVTLSATSVNTITVNYATSDGTATAGEDYTAASGTLTFAAGETSKTFTVTVLDDATDEAHETVTLTLSSPSNATLLDDTGFLTITDDEEDILPRLSIDDVTTSDESAGDETFTVTLSETSPHTITIDYATSNGTATAGEDYTETNGTLTFATGETSKTFTVAILADALDEASEIAILTLSNPGNALLEDGTGMLAITDDDDTPSLSIDDVTTENEDAGNTTFTVALSAASGQTVTVDYGTSNDTLSFTPANIATSAAGAEDLEVADMDGDGDLDIVSGSSGDNTVAWYENDGAANPSWNAADIVTTTDAYGVYLGDIDGDGKLDIAATGYSQDAISWLKNNGAADPSWGDAIDIDNGAHLDGNWDVHIADMDGDGDLDILSAASIVDTLAWHENDGEADPGFTTRIIIDHDDADAPNGVVDIDVADIDGDGDLDILSASYWDHKVAWYENDGAADPSFTLREIATSAQGAWAVTAADMDGDGDMDIVSASYEDDTIAWYENDGAADPSFTAEDIATSADGAVDVQVADMDGDGDLDIVSAAWYADTISWYENDGAADPSWRAFDIATNADCADGIHLADMDSDGDLDIVSSSYCDNTIAWYESNAADNNIINAGLAGIDYTAASGTLTFAPGETTKTFTVPILADTRPENNETVTITLSNAANASLNDTTATLTITDDDTLAFAAVATINVGDPDYPFDVEAADMDSDGDLDIVSVSFFDNTIAWYESDGAATPSFTVREIATDKTHAQSITVADMDSDGDLDIVSASGGFDDSAIAWYENDGAADPSFTASVIDTNADGACDVEVADMDGDGDLDIVSGSYEDDTIAWYENNGAADPTWTAIDIATNADGQSADYAIVVRIADMDGDGDLDIVSSSNIDDTIAWYENDGAADPTFAPSDITTDEDGAYSVDLADMDGDGDMDIVSTAGWDHTIAWYENDGAADPTWAAADISAGELSYPRVAHLVDIDSDGDIDILVASGWDNTISWYENDGAENPGFTANIVDDSADYPNALDAADLDGDGDLDIVTDQSGTDSITWYESTLGE